MSTFSERPGRPATAPRSRSHGKFLHDRLKTSRAALALLVLNCVLVPGTSVGSDDETKILFDAAASSSLVVEVEQMCSEERLRSIEAEVRWGILSSDQTKDASLQAMASSTEVSIDLTEFPRGFERGDFKRIAVPAETILSQKRGLQPGDDLKPPGLPYSYLLTDLAPGVMYNARLLIRTDQGWVPSGTVRFRTPICAVDMADRDAGGDQ